jgi:hypothetical protein
MHSVAASITSFVTLCALFSGPACVAQNPAVRQISSASLHSIGSWVGHTPLLPVHESATSHSPAAARQIVVADRKPSTQVLAVPEQESVPSQAPPFDVPTQVVVAAAKPSAGQAPDEPVQLSATSH